MKNFENLFAAWMVVWAVFFVYEAVYRPTAVALAR